MNKYPVDNIVVYDLEVYPNYFLAGFKFPSGEYYQYKITETYTGHIEVLRRMIEYLNTSIYNLAGFNSSGYDDLVLTAVLKEPTVATAYKTSYQIIMTDTPRWEFDNDINSIDLMQVLPGRIGLKKIGVAMAHEKLQELPFDPHQPLTPEQMVELDVYNLNDLDITQKLVHEVQKELDLRSRMSNDYDVDVRSKGEAAIAEMVLTTEYLRATGVNAKTLKTLAREALANDASFMVNIPSWWTQLKKFPVDSNVHKVRKKGDEIFRNPIRLHERYMAKGSLSDSLFLGDRWYTMGVGGLHSVDGPGQWVPEEDETLVDIDVTSYYPFLMITQNLFPHHWGHHFINIYKRIVEDRLRAKSTGDKTTADVLKIVINGTYGKTADPYSALWDPRVTASVTVSGQLALLTLIAMFTDAGGRVVSANTDGISLLCKTADYEKMKQTVATWEEMTGLNMEYTPYKGIYQADVNNYIALTTDNKIKKKGKFNIPKVGKVDLRHAPLHQICARAVMEYLQNGTEIRDTVMNCTDLQEFIITQQVKGNYRVYWQGQELGKMVRFYKSDDSKKRGPIMKEPLDPFSDEKPAMVANSEMCVPVQNLPDKFPDDIDYHWYIVKAMEWLISITEPKKPGMNNVAMMMIKQGLTPAIVDPHAARLSRARPIIGEIDFTSIRKVEAIGVATGRDYNIMAVRQANGVISNIMVTDRHYPSKTRPKIMKDNGWELLYSGNVAVNPYSMWRMTPTRDMSEFYTEAEMRKVKP